MESGKPALNRPVRSFQQQGGFAEMHLNEHLKRTLALIWVITRYVNQYTWAHRTRHPLCMGTEHSTALNPVEETRITLLAAKHINKIKPLE